MASKFAGAFDDLVPAPSSIASAFDDLIPVAEAPKPLPVGEGLMMRARSGIGQAVGGAQQMLGEQFERYVGPSRNLIGDVINVTQGIDPTIPDNENPALRQAREGVAGFADQGAAVAEQARFESKEAQQGITAPESFADAFGNPGNTLRYYGGLMAESAPMMAAAMATRNPAVATAATGVGTAGQTYGTERAKGASPQEAFDRAGVSGFMESGLGLVPFEKALGAGSLGRRMVKAGLSEAGTEGVTGVGQLVATDAMKGKDTSRADINRVGIDSAIVGGGIGAGMAVLGSGRPDQKAKTASEQTQDAIQQARGRQDFRDFERELNDSLTPTARPAPRTPAEAGSQAAEDALAQARARTAEPPPAPGKPLNPLLDADAIRAQQGQPPLPETLTRRGRDEKYGVDVEMTPDGKGGYLHVETDASGRREKKIEGTGSGIYQGKWVLNEEGEFVSTNTINRSSNEKDTAKRPFQPPTKEQRQAVVDLVAEIAFERSRGNMARAESLESTLADIAMGRVAATPAPVAAPPLGDIPAESTTDLDAAIDAMLAPTTETAPDGRLGTSAPIAAPPVVGSGGLVDATAAAPDPAAGAVGDVAPETGRRPFLTPDDVAREKFTARATEAGLSPEQIAQMTPDTLADDVTGFFDGRLKGVKSGTILRAQEHVEATGEPAFYVDGDIVNLGGLNKAAGENMEAANAHYRAMTDILRAELESTGGDIVPLRTGGDEVGAVVVNAPEPAIRAAMTAANAKVRAYAQANGFGDIPHTKADRTDRGVGLHLGLAPIQPGASLSDIIEASSAEIAASKGGTPDVNGSQTERLGPVAPVGPAGSVGGSVAAEAQGAGGQDAARLGQAPSTQGDAQGVRAAPQVIPAEAPSAPTVTAPPPSARPAPKGRSTLRAIAKTIGLDLADFKRHGVDPANFRGGKGSLPGLFRKQGGMTLSYFREWAQENEYLPRDPENAPPTVSDDDALDLFYRLFANEEAVALGDVDANLQAKAEQDRKRSEDRLNTDPAAAMQRQRARAIGNQPAIEALADFDNGLLTAPGLQKRLDDAETYDESAVPFSRAPANQPGLLDDATPQERVESERQRRDDQRNGKAGSGRTDMASGDGDLFAGNRPDQSSLFSRTDKPKGIALNILSRVVRSLFSGWTNAPTVRAVQSVSDVPADVRERARLEESEGTPEGFFDPQTETVWLIADAISTPARARWVAYHEVTGHYGIRGVVERIGKGAGSLRKAFAATRSNPTIDKLARAIAFDRGLSDAEQNVATEEALAELSAAEETGDWQHLADRYNVTVPASMRPGIRGAIDRFVQSIKRLFSIIAEGRTDAFTDADWRELVAGARRYVRKKPEPKAEPENFDVDLEFDVDVDGETVKATGNAQRMLDLAQKRIDNLTRLAECIAA